MAGHTQDEKDRLQAAFSDGDLPTIYFNGFAINLGVGDFTLLLERNGQPAVVLNTSYTVAKTLAQKLNGLVSILESKTGNTIMSTDDVKKSLDEESEANDG